MNVIEGPEQLKTMTTGEHVICAVSCVYCQEILGWKYVRHYLIEVVLTSSR